MSANLLKKETLAQVPSCKFCEISKNTFIYRTPPVAASCEKYITFSVLIEKEVTRIGKNGWKITKTISYRLQFIVNARFMANSL